MKIRYLSSSLLYHYTLFSPPSSRGGGPLSPPPPPYAQSNLLCKLFIEFYCPWHCLFCLRFGDRWSVFDVRWSMFDRWIEEIVTSLRLLSFASFLVRLGARAFVVLFYLPSLIFDSSVQFSRISYTSILVRGSPPLSTLLTPSLSEMRPASDGVSLWPLTGYALIRRYVSSANHNLEIISDENPVGNRCQSKPYFESSDRFPFLQSEAKSWKVNAVF